MSLPLFRRFLFVCFCFFVTPWSILFYSITFHIHLSIYKFKHAFGFIFISALNGVVDCIKIAILDWIFFKKYLIVSL